MGISDERAAELKTWIIQKLEHISDADSDVLADYVLALLRSGTPDDALRGLIVENLEDFLKDHTAGFVDELLQTVAPKAIPPTSAGGSASQSLPSAPPNPQVASPSFTAPAENGRGKSGHAQKRSFRPGYEAQHGRGVRGGRIEKPTKPLPRAHSAHSQGRGAPNAAAPGAPLPFDPQQAAAAIWTLQSMGIPVPPLVPGIMPMPMPNRPGGGMKQGAAGKRCRDYYSKGICHRGINCPYLHDEHQVIAPTPLEPGIAASSPERDIEAAQERMEKRKALKAANDERIADIAKRRRELEARHRAEKQRLASKVRERGEEPEPENSMTAMLRAQLAKLEEEAQNLGLEPDPW